MHYGLDELETDTLTSLRDACDAELARRSAMAKFEWGWVCVSAFFCVDALIDAHDGKWVTFAIDSAFAIAAFACSIARWVTAERARRATLRAKRDE